MCTQNANWVAKINGDFWVATDTYYVAQHFALLYTRENVAIIIGLNFVTQFCVKAFWKSSSFLFKPRLSQIQLTDWECTTKSHRCRNLYCIWKLPKRYTFMNTTANKCLCFMNFNSRLIQEILSQTYCTPPPPKITRIEINVMRCNASNVFLILWEKHIKHLYAFVVDFNIHVSFNKNQFACILTQF